MNSRRYTLFLRVAGFTLIELLVVIAVIAILASLIPSKPGAPPFIWGLVKEGLGQTKENEVRVPSDMIAVTDTIWRDVVDPNNRAACQTWAAIPRTGDEGDYPHQNGVNMVFCDGHVEKIKSRQFRNASDDFWKRWNRDHEPHPETRLVKSD